MTVPERIVDAHHHLWNLDEIEYPWLMERGKVRFFGDPTPIQRNYLHTDFLEDFGDLPIVKSVHIQVGARLDHSVAETEWLDTEARKSSFPTAIVAFADLTDDSLDAQLNAHAEASARLRGVRQIVSRSADEDKSTGTASLLSDPAFLCGLKKLVESDLRFDLQLTPGHLTSAARLFSRVEGLQLALCHAGSLQEISVDGVKAWESGLRELRDGVAGICKLSGHGMFNHSWTDVSVRDWVLRAIDIYSPSRIAFGSNFPVDRLYASYLRLWEAFFNATAGFSEAERTQMFGTNAEEFYAI